MFYQGTAELLLDASNRMLIPRRLLDYASIEKEAVLAGQYGRIEIWGDRQYTEVTEEMADYAALAEKILGGAMNEPENE